MAKNKTHETEKDVFEFIEEFTTSEQKRKDSHELIALMTKATGFEPKMWGPSIIGFGTYHYKYVSGHEGDMPILGFSPRKAALSLYIYTGLPEHEFLLKDLGKFKMGKVCMYVNKLADIDRERLVHMMDYTVAYMNEKKKN
ncbi:DUF1801 domain-containing protein [Fluviicola sp.]|uniref:DUF1801 domain-containing protein n=1 Tax=Fluviicola sp. TaxID=1917219 RepID=UPI002608B0F0|nr:DUF1801 domain-containing protein [Fluviicola sp.]